MTNGCSVEKPKPRAKCETPYIRGIAWEVSGPRHAKIDLEEKLARDLFFLAIVYPELPSGPLLAVEAVGLSPSFRATALGSKPVSFGVELTSAWGRTSTLVATVVLNASSLPVLEPSSFGFPQCRQGAGSGRQGRSSRRPRGHVEVALETNLERRHEFLLYSAGAPVILEPLKINDAMS